MERAIMYIHFVQVNDFLFTILTNSFNRYSTWQYCCIEYIIDHIFKQMFKKVGTFSRLLTCNTSFKKADTI